MELWGIAEPSEFVRASTAVLEDGAAEDEAELHGAVTVTVVAPPDPDPAAAAVTVTVAVGEQTEVEP